jgi:hypothetical protein
VQASALPTAEEAGSSQKGAPGLFSFGRDGAEPIPVQFLSAFTEKTEVPSGMAQAVRTLVDELRFLQGRLSSGRHVGPVQMSWSPSCCHQSELLQSVELLVPATPPNRRLVYHKASPAVKTGHYRPARLLRKELGRAPGLGNPAELSRVVQKALKPSG